MKRQILKTVIVLTGFMSLPVMAEIQIDGRNRVGFGAVGELGSGYNLEKNQFGIADCIDGKVVSSTMISKEMPFLNPVVLTHDDENSIDSDTVEIRFTALTDEKKIVSLEGPLLPNMNTKNREVCGDHYVSRKMIAGGFRLTFTFFPSEGSSVENLKLYLKQSVRTLDSVAYLIEQHPDLAVYNGTGYAMASFQDWSVLWPQLTDSMGTCGQRGGSCQNFVKKAYELAQQLNQLYPTERIRKLGSPDDHGLPADYWVKLY